MKKFYLLVAGFLFSGNFVFAQDSDPFAQTCTQAHAQADLDINNVRAAILANGNMWQSTIPGCTAGYTVPKNGTANSIFISGLWFGGLDDGGQLMTACMTYRQRGVDFWAGPIDTVNAATNKGVCWAYDRFWKLNRSEVEAFREHYSEASYTIPEAILTWPANGNTQAGYSKQQAPFIDNNGDGIYDPHAGDYPAFALNGQPNCNYNLLGDQAIWWVFNDKGNEHGETGGAPFGMEIQAMAFAYHTKDETDNATFYRYKIINRSTSSWNQMWMGQYVDTDLGGYDDDYIGCDVSRGMSYVYNGDLNDGYSALPTVGTYGAHPPAQGFDWLQGPLADVNDWIDNDHDSLVDETGERVTMSMFKYFGNDFTILGYPDSDVEYYNFLRGLWKDGSPMTYGGYGYGGQVSAMYMYPGDSDPYGWGTNGIAQPVWSEITEGNMPFDRRFLSSVGSFSMQPGEVQIVTVGLPWTRDTAATGTNLTSLEKLKQVDDQMQQLFESCFAMPCAAEAAPSFTATVKNRQVYFTAESSDGIYNWNFGDNTSASSKHPSHTYTENGTYNVCYTVTTSCGTQSYCALVKIDSYENDLGPKLQRLEGKGSGNQVIDFTPESIAEIFTSGENKVRYPWFEPLHAPVRVTYEDYNSLVDGDYRIAFDGIADTSGWKLWRVGSTDTIYSDSSITNGDKQIISQYGLGIRVKQVKNPGMNLNPDRNGYLGGSMSFSDPQKNWLSAVADKDESNSYNWIRGGILHAELIGSCEPSFNSVKIGPAFADYNEDFQKWIGGTWSPYRIGSTLIAAGAPCYSTGVVFNNTATISQTKIENVANVNIVITPDKSKWSRCAVLETGSNTALTENGTSPFRIRSHASVDKEGRTVAQGGLSDPLNPEAADYIGANGMGWFPGYAYNLETGERLNISFGENSSLPAENGRDMIWNPTSNEKTNLNQILFGGMHYIYVFGHNGDAVFQSSSNGNALAGHLKDVPAYDNGKAIYDILHLADQGYAGDIDRGEVFRDAMWVNIPLLNPGHDLLESDATIRLRVAKPFAEYNTSTVPENDNKPMYGFKIDKMNPGCNLYDGDVSVFPNPFTESCTILFDNTENKKYNLKLYDLQGRLVRRIDDVITDRIVIDALGLNSGVYIYSLETEGAKTKSGRIVLR